MSGTVRSVTRELLRQLGLTTAFGNPGTTEVPFLIDWPDDFRYVLGLQESVVVGMADGYATATGTPVLVNLHSAGGVGHSLGAVFNAFRNRTPMVIVAGQQVRSLLPHDPFLGAVEATNFPQPYVKWAAEPARAEDVPAALVRALRTAEQPPRGPTFLSVPADDWDRPCAPIAFPTPVAPPAPDPGAMDDLAEALSGCERPVIVAGPAIAEDGVVPEVVALAERTRAAVWASPMSSRASFPERHAQFRGFLSPEQRFIADALGEHDLALVIGAPAFTYHVFRGPPTKALPPLHVLSDDPQILARMPGGRGVAAHVGASVRALLPRVGQSGRAAPPARVATTLPPAQERPTGAHVMSVLSEVLPANAVVVEEAPTHRGEIQAFLPISPPEQDFLTVASGTLGFGMPAAVGAALARPDRPVVAVLGDGSSMYGIQALWTAAREGASVAFLVLDNEEYAAVRLLGEVGETKMPGVDLGGIDFVRVATGLGCHASRVEDLPGLRAALGEAFRRPGPTLLHVPVARSTSKLY